MRLADFASRLKGVKWSGDSQLTSRCPVESGHAHGDATRSFSAGIGDDGRILLTCFAGHTADQICGALGIEVADLFPSRVKDSKATKPRRPVSLRELADAKKFPVEWLLEHGVADFPDGSGVAIGYFDENEAQAPRLRKRTALRAKDGSTWVGPKGVQPIPYGLWLLKDARAKGQLIIVEGETDCWALWFHGYPALGLPGATNVKGLLAEHLAGIEQIYVVKEPDAAGSAFPARVAARVRELGSNSQIRSIAMPSGAKDPCDLHVAGDFDAPFLAALTAAVPLDAKAEKREIVSEKAPHVVAEAYVRRWATIEAVRTLHRWNAQFWVWTGTHFVARSDEDQRALIWCFLTECVDLVDKADRVVAPTTWHASNIFDALKGLINLPLTEVRPPQWIGADLTPESSAVVAVNNGILSLSLRTLQAATPRWFAFASLRTDFREDAECPQWLAFLATLWDDQQSRDTLQEIFGYLLTTDMSQQKIFAIIGAPRSGKGTIGRVLAALLGPDSIARPALADFGYQFGLENLIGKTLAIISDARLDASASGGILAERLLAISGEDSINVTRKYQTTYGGLLDIRFLFLANELPRFRDASGALPNRFILLKTEKSFLGREDPQLPNRLVTELSGILNWAIEGWMRLQERGHFIQPEAAAALKEQFDELASPLLDFLEEECIPEGSVIKSDLYKRYLKWCEDLKGRPMPMPIFFRDLHAARPRIRTIRPHVGPRSIEGLRLMTEMEKTERMTKSEP